MKTQTSVIQHDNRDLGFHRDSINELVHYFRSNINSHLAMSHCGVIVRKEDMRSNTGVNYCPVCDTIEDMRRELDGKNEPNL